MTTSRTELPATERLASSLLVAVAAVKWAAYAVAFLFVLGVAVSPELTTRGHVIFGAVATAMGVYAILRAGEAVTGRRLGGQA